MQQRFKASQLSIKKELDSQGLSQLVLFDSHGEVISSAFPPTISQRLIDLLDNKPKAVSRSSGGLGLVNVTPHLFLKHTSENPEVLIKVIFHDLERNSQYRIISKNIVTHAKVIPIQDIKAGFPIEDKGPHTYVVDFGMGIIPVYVFRFYRDSDGIPWALFVRYDELEQALIQPEAKSSPVSIYEIPVALLRTISPLQTNGQRDFLWAKEHAAQLKERGEVLVPPLLLVQGPVDLPQGLTLGQIEQWLLDIIHPSAPKEFELLIPLNENPD